MAVYQDKNGGLLYSIFLPYVPKSLNKLLRSHWMQRKKMKGDVERHFQEWWVTLDKKERGLWQKVIPFKQCEYVQIQYIFGNKHKHDFDNYSGKLIFDVLKDGRILVDDKSEVIGQMITIFSYNKEFPGILITIKPKEIK